MAKNNREEKGIVTSALPIPSSDAPLVIDLPDGQKIVLGRISSGAVIEVATWRGTGRPDSRTNRIMLGMSDTSSLDGSSTPAPEVASKKRFSLKALTKKSVEREEKPASASTLIRGVSRLTSKYNAKRPVEETHNLEIDAWIEKLSSDLQSKSSSVSASARKSEIVEKSKTTRSSVTKVAKPVRKHAAKSRSK